MIFILGSKSYIEDLGESGESLICNRCNNRVNLHIINAYSKFTCFFIPLFRLTSKYYLSCPVCSHSQRLERQKAKQLLQHAN